MLIVMKSDATPAQVDEVCRQIELLGLRPVPIPGGGRTAIGITGNDRAVDPGPFVGLEGVRDAIPVSAPYKLVSREWRPNDTVVTLPNGTRIGGGEVCVMGGPCSIESDAQIHAAAAFVAEAGATVLRGGAFKPRTSPYAFQGLGEEGLRMLREAGRAHDLATVSEAMDIAGAELVAEYVDIVQVGARNMHSFGLLRALGSIGKPILLKRGPASTIEEWLLAAEYILDAGNSEVILCERGIRGFDPATRNVLDLAAIPVAKSLTHLPVIADPSHGTGRRDAILPMSRAAVAAGADGLIIEAHPHPDQARSDGKQSLYPAQFHQAVLEVRQVARALGRGLAGEAVNAG